MCVSYKKTVENILLFYLTAANHKDGKAEKQKQFWLSKSPAERTSFDYRGFNWPALSSIDSGA